MNKLAFRKAGFFWAAILAVGSVFLMFFLASSSQEDMEKFCRMLAAQPKKIRRMKLKEEREITRQIRRGTTKKVWISDGSLRKILSVAGARSEISVFSDKKTSRIVETFYDASGVIQDALLFRLQNGKEVTYNELQSLPKDTLSVPIQRFRYFEADQAVYDFALKNLVATNIYFWTYIAQGHEVVENFEGLASIAEGFASRMTIVSAANDEGQFFAEDLKLEIKGDQGL
jgi:hypothetical protein